MYSILISGEKDKDDLYLNIKDFPKNPIAASFLYSDAVDKIKKFIPKFTNELNLMDIKDLKRDNVYMGKGVEPMVEETYKYDVYFEAQMTEEICFLKREIYCWRKVAADGNCFYRSVMFSWLEYLIFNKKISILKIILADLDTKCHVEDKEISYLNGQFTYEEKLKAMTIMEIIIEFLNNNNIMEGYLTLLKAYNVTRVFDRIMIFYLRFLLYNYISKNKNKLLNKSYPVFLGNLLSSEYQKENGTFLYKDYFINNLLRYHNCPEKLAVYLIPYVLKVNLNILIYYYKKDESRIETKFFDCGLPDKDKKRDIINLLYRKSHYDIYYSKEYYDDFQPLLDKFCNLKMKYKEDYFIVKPNDLKEKEKKINEIFPYNPEDNVIYNKNLFQLKMNKKQK
jgi:hypothetical protein